MWQLALIDCLSSFHLQKYSPLVGSYILKNQVVLTAGIRTHGSADFVSIVVAVPPSNDCDVDEVNVAAIILDVNYLKIFRSLSGKVVE